MKEETIKYYRLEKILSDFLPISKSQFYEYINSQLIPKPVKVGRSSFWEHNKLMIALKELPSKLEKKGA